MSSRFTALILGLILVAGCLPLAAQTYTFQQLIVPWTPNAWTSALDSNRRGAIVGKVDSISFKRDVNGVFERLDNPGSYPFHNTRANGINDYGVVVGLYYNYSRRNYSGFFYNKGVYADYFPQPFTSATTASQINSINNSGNFVGRITTADGNVHPFISINGVVSELKCPGVTSLSPNEIGADNTVVGPGTKNGITVGFIIGPAGRCKTVQFPGSTLTGFDDINTALHKVVGYYWVQGRSHGLVYDYVTDEMITVDYPDPNTTGCGITSINAKGVLVGTASTTQHPQDLSWIATPQ